MSHRIRFTLRAVAALLAASGIASVAQAAIFTVGSPSGQGQPCTHGTIQSAINAANSSPGADTIRLTRSLTYQPEANTINTAQELTIEGGYATCTQATPDNTYTVVSGAGGAAEPVFNIIAPAGAWIRLRRLTISGGDVATTGTGGGIRFSGDGILDIEKSNIINNIAGYGGGIHAHGTGSNAELVIGEDVLIVGNTARYDGGGVYSSQMETTMTAPGSIIFNNEATGTGSSGGYGGGLYIRGNTRDSHAYVSAAITNNRARRGGGVALGGTSSGSGAIRNAVLHLFTTDPAPNKRGIINNNSASISGGGIYVEGDDDGSDVDARAILWNADILNNDAPDGAAVRLAGDGHAYLQINTPVGVFSRPSAALPCPVGSACGIIEGNVAATGGTGAVIQGGADYSHIHINDTAAPTGGVRIEGNRGSYLIQAGESDIIGIRNALITDNEISRDLIYARSNTELKDSTIAGNVFTGPVYYALNTGNAGLTIHRSLLWQPGTTLLNRTGGAFDSADNMVNEIASFGGNFNGAVVANPRFVDPELGDYSLRVGSPAIDMAPAIGGDDRDAHGRPRDRDLPHTDSDNGTRDIGALERQSLQPMVLNSDFDSSLHLWTPVLAGSTTRDATQNVSGGASSGSAHVTRANPASGQETHGLSQCIHLPGPAVYELNGWGRGSGNMVVAGDSASLLWEYRRNGGDTCINGAPDASGWHSLNTGSSSWHRPAQPALINAPDAIGGRSSITVTLVAREFGPGTAATHAWFDGITLEVDAPSGELLSDGFEGCPPARGGACR